MPAKLNCFGGRYSGLNLPAYANCTITFFEGIVQLVLA